MKGSEAINILAGGQSAGWAFAVLILFLTLVQVAPINVNPWDSILRWLGKKINGELEKRIESVEDQIHDMWICQHRQGILTFARECRDNIRHSSDEWTNVLNVAEEYEEYVRNNHITNGIVTQDTSYLRSLYQEMSREKNI